MNIDDVISDVNQFMNDELEKEHAVNSIEIADLSRKIRIIKANSLKSRGSYLVRLILASSLVNAIIASLWHIPMDIYSLITISVTCFTFEKIKFKMEGHRAELREFSNAKTEKDRTQEQSMYEKKKQELLERNAYISVILDSGIFNNNVFSEEYIAKEYEESHNEEVYDIEKDQSIEEYIVVDGRAVKQYSETDIIPNIEQEEVVQEHVKQKVKSRKTP